MKILLQTLSLNPSIVSLELKFFNLLSRAYTLTLEALYPYFPNPTPYSSNPCSND